MPGRQLAAARFAAPVERAHDGWLPRSRAGRDVAVRERQLAAADEPGAREPRADNDILRRPCTGGQLGLQEWQLAAAGSSAGAGAATDDHFTTTAGADNTNRVSGCVTGTRVGVRERELGAARPSAGPRALIWSYADFRGATRIRAYADFRG